MVVYLVADKENAPKTMEVENYYSRGYDERDADEYTYKEKTQVPEKSQVREKPQVTFRGRGIISRSIQIVFIMVKL